MAAVAIGVSDAKPLKFLPGAVNGARAFHGWAQALGYEARLVIDDNELVTLNRLRQEFEALLAPGTTQIHRLLIYFAGHGLIREAEEGLWLLSDWHRELRAVAVEVLKRRLYLYGVEQIAIFADACRSLPRDIQAADLTADGVLGRGPSRQAAVPAIDKFIAAQDGTETLMVPGASPDDDRCLFSGVLLEGLWGTKPKAFSTRLKDKVTSQSLGGYLRTEVPLLAARYGWTLIPTISPTFPEGDDVYFGDGPPRTPPVFPDWPPPKTLIRPEVKFGTTWGYEDAGRKLLKDQFVQQLPRAFDTQSGFAVDGERVMAIWTGDEQFVDVCGHANWWRIGSNQGGILDRPAPVLLEFANGLFAATTALPKFIASILVNQRGVSALVYREIYAAPRIAQLTEQAIAGMEEGGLRSDAIMDLALELRQDKHADPVLGVISAYLYDSIGDVDSIRRMAFYYIQHAQPIPYDVALLAQLLGKLREGLLWTTVPEVPAREPRTERERQFTWAYSSTPSASGIVGGWWPWLRQGWTFLDDPADDGSTLILPGLIELTPQLTSARFTTLDTDGGHRMARLFGLSQRYRKPSE